MKSISNDDFRRFVEESHTYADVCRKIGWKPQGGNYRYVKKYINELGLDTSHFTMKGRVNSGIKYNEKSVEDYLTTNSYIKADRLKWKLFSSGLKEYKCEKCGISRWNGKQISLQLHHINGDNTDNRLENLQILCPNCHSQTDNYCGANNRHNGVDKKHYCKCCGKEINKTQTGLCDECYKKSVNTLCTRKKLKNKNLSELCRILTYYSCCCLTAHSYTECRSDTCKNCCECSSYYCYYITE